jgi:hypothetical protein
MSTEINCAGNNILLSGVGVTHRLDSYHVAVPSGVVSLIVLPQTGILVENGTDKEIHRQTLVRPHR